jgi:hypothetical protein
METLLQILLQCMGFPKSSSRKVLPENVVNTDAYLDDEIIKTWVGRREKATRRGKQDNPRGKMDVQEKGKHS